MEVPFIRQPSGAQKIRISENILKWHQQQITEIEADLFAQKKRLADAVRVLASNIRKRQRTTLLDGTEFTRVMMTYVGRLS